MIISSPSARAFVRVLNTLNNYCVQTPRLIVFALYFLPRMSLIDPQIFRAYDIRGKAHEKLTEDVCRLIACAFGSILRERTGKDHPRICVGRDARTHGHLFERAVIEGLLSTGCSVTTIGETPSPVNYFTVCTQNFDGGVQVTASHNPAEDNGLKLTTAHAHSFSGDDIQNLKRRIEIGGFLHGEGMEESYDASTPYREHLTKVFSSCGKEMTVAVDYGNSVAGPCYGSVLQSIGCEIHALYAEPDGTFPNHPADPSKRETLKELQDLVQEKKCTLGLAFDGDGDRLGIVDDRGNIVSADHILLLLAKDHLERLPGKPVVFTVSNSSILETEIRAWGGAPVMTKVGHPSVEHALEEHGALLGGEQSGHFFCGENYFLFDDALVAALRILTILQKKNISLSALLQEFPPVYQAEERRPACPDEEKAQIIEKVKRHFLKNHLVNTLDGVRIDFGDGAWAGIRQSNTSPCISICAEARSTKKLQEVEETILMHLKSYNVLSW